MKFLETLCLGVALTATMTACSNGSATGRPTTAEATAPAAQRDSADKVLGAWAPGPRLAGQEMIAKYGQPQEVTSERIIWHAAGPYKKIMLTREGLPHEFPLTHMDYLEHTISYNVPADKTDEVHAFDASITIYRVAGELSARCDLESNNVLTLNLANDIVMNNKTVAAARQEFGEAVTARTLGNPPPSTVALQFQPMSAAAAADKEKTSLPGTSQRADHQPMALTGATTDPKMQSDGEIMALLIALNENELHAAMTAEQKQAGPDTMAYAKTLHKDHGMNIADTEKIGVKIGVTPIETAAVDALHDKGAQQLAPMVTMTGSKFEGAFADAMRTGHTDALKMLDEWITKANNPALKQHLTETRGHIERHLTEAQQLKSRN